MATAESVKNKLQGLIDTANETTGGSDTDLTAAIATLIAGFGQGGGDSGGGGVQVYAGSVTATATTNNTRVDVDFGFAPDFILVFQNADITGSSSRYYPIFACGFSTTAAAALSVPSTQYCIGTITSAGSKVRNSSVPIDTTTNWPSGIRCVDANGFNLSNVPWYSKSLFVIAMKLL